MHAESLASTRVPIMLVADDQIMPESSPGRLQQAADIASQWAECTGQQYHVATPDERAVLLLGPDSLLSLYNLRPTVLSGVAVPGTLLKKWVGILRDSFHSFEPFMEGREKVARGAFVPLCGMAREHLAPRAEIRSSMQAKVDNALF